MLAGGSPVAMASYALYIFLDLPESQHYTSETHSVIYMHQSDLICRLIRCFIPSSVADVPSRHRLRSSTSDDPIVPAVHLTSVGSRAFPVAGARIWNTLPLHVTSASSLTAFKQHLKLHLFCFSFPGLYPV